MRAKSLGTRAVTLDKPVNLSVLMRCLSIDVITESFCGWVATPLELRYDLCVPSRGFEIGRADPALESVGKELLQYSSRTRKYSLNYRCGMRELQRLVAVIDQQNLPRPKSVSTS
jgi:hypothetical protein